MPSKFNKKSTKVNFGKSNEFVHPTTTESAIVRDFAWYDYPFTIIMATFLIVIHFLFWILAPTDILFTIPNQFVNLFAQDNSYILYYGPSQWYRFVTSMFIHANIVHLGGNILFFLIFSIRLEELKGWKVALIVFFFAGLAGNFLTFFILWNDNFATLGASGAIMGIFMADLIIMRKTYNKGSLTMLAFLVVFGSLFIDGSAQTNIFAHLGGLIGGAVFMLALEKIEKKHGKILSR